MRAGFPTIEDAIEDTIAALEVGCSMPRGRNVKLRIELALMQLRSRHGAQLDPRRARVTATRVDNHPAVLLEYDGTKTAFEID